MTTNTSVETQKFRVIDLKAAAYNPRTISDTALSGLQDSLNDLGVLEFPVVNLGPASTPLPDPRLVSGHQRVRGLIETGVQFVDCIVVRMDPAAEMSANLTMNNPAIRGEWDSTKALSLLEPIMSKLPLPSHMGFDDLSERMHVAASRLEAGKQKASDALSEADEPKTHSKNGYVYTLGDHRLVCGSFEFMFDILPSKAAACITDPPYNVAYKSSSGESIKGDDLSLDEWASFLALLCSSIMKATVGPCFVFMGHSELPALEHAWLTAKGEVDEWLFWVKDRFTLGWSNYHYMHEACLFGGPKGQKKHRAVGLGQVNALSFPKPSANLLHPTQKPVELIRSLMEPSTSVRDLVIDPFGGSGTTLTVAQELQRVCYTSDLDPKHCDTIRKRWCVQVHGTDDGWQKKTPGKKL